jgi:Flp pilus assembly protein TadD
LLWNGSVAAWLRAPERAAASVVAAEPWLICTTMGALAADADSTQLDADFIAGKRALAAGDWNAAIAALKLAALREPDNADIQNYIGYAYRRLRHLELAFAHYDRAVQLNPRHRSAHEHLGEAFLVSGDPRRAREHLAALQRICLIPCVEYDDLRKAIALYERGR